MSDVAVYFVACSLIGQGNVDRVELRMSKQKGVPFGLGIHLLKVMCGPFLSETKWRTATAVRIRQHEAPNIRKSFKNMSSHQQSAKA